MPDTETMLPAEALRQGLIETNVSRPVAWSMIAAFLLLVYGVPAAQLAVELARRETPQVLTLFEQLPAKQHLRAWEEDLGRVSVVRAYVQPMLQEMLSESGGFGNSQAVIGRDGWLFYRPGIDYVAGLGLLDPLHLAARRRKAVRDLQAAPQPDPRIAIREFNEQCARHGARLIVVPIPDKVLLQPGELSARLAPAEASTPANNPDFQRLLSELRADGVDIFDPTPDSIAPGDCRYLTQDTHWTPAFAEEVAAALARHVKSFLETRAQGLHLNLEEQSIERLGDLVDMLKLGPDQDAFSPQRVLLRRVVESRGRAPWRADPQAEVLLLGDSFTNIFSVAEMGWGDSAGLAEHLCYQLQRPVDRLARNDAGAYATRQMLATELAKGRNRLAGKRVVIWEFAMRELSVGDWKHVPLRLGDPQPSRFIVPAPGEERIVTGTVRSVARAPRPGTVPYKDHIVAVHLVDLEDASGPIPGGEALVYMWSMRNNNWTPAATYRIDQTLRLNLRPWSDVAQRLETINRGELSDDEINLQDPCWGQESKDD